MHSVNITSGHGHDRECDCNPRRCWRWARSLTCQRMAVCWRRSRHRRRLPLPLHRLSKHSCPLVQVRRAHALAIAQIDCSRLCRKEGQGCVLPTAATLHTLSGGSWMPVLMCWSVAGGSHTAAPARKATDSVQTPRDPRKAHSPLARYALLPASGSTTRIKVCLQLIRIEISA
jgi:hypothetical protein